MSASGQSFIYRPVEAKTSSKRNLRISVLEEHFFTKLQRLSKVVNPNADVLPVVLELLNVRVEFTENGVVFQQVTRFPEVPSFLGLLRALMVIRFRYPDVYKKFVELAKYLSYEIDEEIHVAPLHALINYPTTGIELIWEKVEELTGISKELYAKSVIDGFRDWKLHDKFSLFKSNHKEDQDTVAEFEASMQVPYWYVENAAERGLSMLEAYSRYGDSELLDEDNILEPPESGVTEEEFRKMMEPVFDVLDSHLKRFMADGEEENNYEEISRDLIDEIQEGLAEFDEDIEDE